MFAFWEIYKLVQDFFICHVSSLVILIQPGVWIVCFLIHWRDNHIVVCFAGYDNEMLMMSTSRGRRLWYGGVVAMVRRVHSNPSVTSTNHNVYSLQSNTRVMWLTLTHAQSCVSGFCASKRHLVQETASQLSDTGNSSPFLGLRKPQTNHQGGLTSEIHGIAQGWRTGRLFYQGGVCWPVCTV